MTAAAPLTTPVEEHPMSEKPKKETTKPKAKTKKAREAKPAKLSAVSAAARALAEEGKAMTCPELIDAMAAKGYWKSPGGKTPAATLYSAILREITTKGKESRFTKAERGKFAATGVATTAPEPTPPAPEAPPAAEEPAKAEPEAKQTEPEPEKAERPEPAPEPKKGKQPAARSKGKPGPKSLQKLFKI
jgi:HB1, ASXL, restriction endonuclease HTH domain